MKTRDITGGLPRVAELFQRRSPKDAGHAGGYHRRRVVRQGHQRQAASIIPDLDGTANEYLIPKKRNTFWCA